MFWRELRLYWIKEVIETIAKYENDDNNKDFLSEHVALDPYLVWKVWAEQTNIDI